ncbi:MAG: molybdate ABC transporter substrate-binding protein [Chthoniobacterales bacterium]
MRSILISIALLFATLARAEEISVYAASSLTDALREIGMRFEKQTGDHVLFNFAASTTLARQIEAGAPAEIFFSADDAQMNGLEQSGRIESGSRRDLLSNVLVIVAPNQSNLQLKSARDLLSVTRIAVGDPKLVPVGVYTRAYLEKQGLWAELEPKIVPTDNVRAGLAVVEAGNADVAFVYRTDGERSKKVKIIFIVPVGEAPRINYPVALVKQEKRSAGAEKFLNYLASDETLRVFEKFGFLVKH